MRQYLISRVKHQVSATCAWRYRWEEFNQCAAREVDCEPDYPLLGLLRCRPFTKVLVCTTWKQATEIALYNAVILALLGILWSLEPPLEDESQLEEELQSPLLLPNQLYHLEQVAIEICRVFEYQLQSVSYDQRAQLRDNHLPKRSVSYSVTQPTRINVILRGIWLRLWPAFRLV